mmetsp:Transcript_86201/g.136936  ORF Transcript_86201/g.136936 Transcript_86201/m.136936 type:complete len:113 (+) Transcript_86201:56-394(+)
MNLPEPCPYPSGSSVTVNQEAGSEEDERLYYCKRQRAFCLKGSAEEAPQPSGMSGAKTLLQTIRAKPRSNPNLLLGNDGDALLLVRKARAFQGEKCAQALAAQLLAEAVPAI